MTPVERDIYEMEEASKRKAVIRRALALLAGSLAATAILGFGIGLLSALPPTPLLVVLGWTLMPIVIVLTVCVWVLFFVYLYNNF